MPSDRLTPGRTLLDPIYRTGSAQGLDVPANLGAEPVKPSQPVTGAPSRRIVLPGCDFPPADAIPVDETGDGNITALSAAFFTLVTITVPDTKTFRLAGIGFGADDESVLRFLTWSIIATPPGIPINGYNLRTGAVGSIRHLADIFSVQGSSVTVTVIASLNAYVLTSHVVCRVRGWFYTEREVVA